ncbi:LytTR family DNA-binding domain-containing protein [Pseudooceanicola sp. 200-1SW]|uniref:LytTR family DNA-binding domain-containing protein n=1 Tax=Pseudooceanicola sp. 200-1SW TaxID=3425949 RepID=UPI003D7FA6EF
MSTVKTSPVQITLKFLNGTSVTFGADKCLKLLSHRFTLISMIAYIFLFSLLAPWDNGASLPYIQQFILLTLAVVISWLGYMLFLKLHAHLMRRKGAVNVWSVFVVIALVVSTTPVMFWLTHLLGGEPLALKPLAFQFIFNIFINEMLMTVLGNFVIPSALMDMQNTHKNANAHSQAPKDDLTSSESGPRYVTLGTETLNAESVTKIEAQQNYVLISTTDSGNRIARISLTGATEKMPKDLGSRIHRSYWVAYSQITKVDKVANGYRISLSDGSTLPAPRSRFLAEVDMSKLTENLPAVDIA